MVPPLDSPVAGSSSPVSKPASSRSSRSSRSPQPRQKQKGKATTTIATSHAESEVTVASEFSDDDGEDEVEKDEIEDITAVGGATAAKTSVSAICSHHKVSFCPELKLHYYG